MENDAPIEVRSIQGRFFLGVNYWPASSGPFMWEEWELQKIEEDFLRMKSIGLNSARIFLFLPHFMRTADRVDEVCLERLDELVKTAKRNSIFLFPSIFVGHMSGENWDFPWSKGQDFYTDPEMVSAEKLLLGTLAERYREEQQIVGWILSNELPLFAGDPDPSIARSWTESMIRVMREGGDTHPIGTGDGLFSQGFRVEWLVDLVDWAGPHLYAPSGQIMDPIKWSYAHEARIAHSKLGKPVLMEEFGSSKTLVSEENEAAYYRNVIYSSLIAGSKGFLAWCFSDFKCKAKRPYLHHSLELKFGVFREDGSPRPSACELRRLSRIDTRVALRRFSVPEGDTGILIPSHQYIDHPFVHWRVDRNKYNSLLLDAFTMARLAGLATEMIREINGFSEVTEENAIERLPNLVGNRLLLVPCPKMLLSVTWDRLLEHARAGGAIYFSYANDNWIPVIRELAGVDHQLKYGEGTIPKGGRISMTFVRDFPPFRKGEKFVVPIAGQGTSMPLCPVKAKEGRALAVDEEGNPMFVMNRIGSGVAFFLSFPFECYLVSLAQSYCLYEYERLYAAMAVHAGLRSTFRSSNRLIEIGTLQCKEEDEILLVALNHSWQLQNARIIAPEKVRSFVDVETEKVHKGPAPRLSLGPKEAKIFSLT